MEIEGGVLYGGTTRQGNQACLPQCSKVIEAAYKTDRNEAETRQRVEKIFENFLGYGYIEHLSRERAVPGTGEPE